ncbi:macrophage migration inhibitory factor 1-like protein [Leptotrombidium deliense]|uniref:L-dopachrome isomerase n=1 Tax=Leptotrombidium deliense TaxID=299467 RepID=A0A443S3Y5_9ACAR|nr:macrophage migration inhibitory factor 1-like protein [Leptotrombidium deliense]
MPALEVITNVPKDKIPADLARNLADTVSKLFGRPAAYVCVTIRPDTIISWGGKDAPAALVHISSIGLIDRERNKKASTTLFPLFHKNLGVTADRLFILFHEFTADNWGFKDSDKVNFG